MGAGMIAAAWIVVLVLLTAYFSGWLEHQENPNRAPVTMYAEDGAREVALRRNRQGHYLATGAINGQEVEFLLDTGATTMSISSDLAISLDLPVGPPSLSWTANGRIITYDTWLDEVRLGDIRLQDVRATINPNTRMEEVLLGMSFLKRVEFAQRGDILTLRQSGRE
uniref:Aspartyl protease family protein n=1 Tax=Candidatus Kentrum sp. MB TaxID=2138164 RepID=A0A450XC86_9GAMM|nr:MAG: aspartyl protease family protein [Candidatus Kentron sp. MB]